MPLWRSAEAEPIEGLIRPGFGDGDVVDAGVPEVGSPPDEVAQGEERGFDVEPGDAEDIGVVGQAGLLHHFPDACFVVALEAAHQEDAHADDIAMDEGPFQSFLEFIEEVVLGALLDAEMADPEADAVEVEVAVNDGHEAFVAVIAYLRQFLV